jgi:dTDP-4-dehydrorhamnose reductase
MWGGIECSRVRVGPETRDQLAQTGHRDRLEDLDRVATLGIRTLRYPLLWEHHADARSIDWTWADERLKRLRALGIRPIVGFVHHGSGPLAGGLLDPGFVAGLAEFAAQVARRYPWVDAYTPVNEPATTARFGGLYGLWHPHRRDVRSFGRCFLNECLATRAAMKAIRGINPSAQLVQTEDVGKTHSTPRLAYQARYENERRWLTFDVLCGRVDPQHPVHAHLVDCGVSLLALESFVEDPCPPDILGMNYYVTSERFLDERLDPYPPHTHGGNGRERYADVDAVRVRAEGLVGAKGLLHELWDRYRRPIAITEVQLACTREEQVRWLVDTWQQAQAARSAGVDVRAITPWALFGAYDWDTLLVEARGHYENGAFDVRSPTPRLTAVGTAIAELVRTGTSSHPALAGPGWWRRPMRLRYPPMTAPETGHGTALTQEPPRAGPPMLVFGAGGTLGQAFLRFGEIRGLHVIGLRRAQVDIEDDKAVRQTLESLRPWAVINCAGYVRVDEAESDRDSCFRANATGAAKLAAACAATGARLATFSTDLVFDGTAGRPYVESDRPDALNVYGLSKQAAEQAVAAALPEALIIRTSAFFGPWDDANFVTQTLSALAARETVRASAEHTVSPTYVPDLVNATLDLLMDGETGLWHLANQGAVSWYDWAVALGQITGIEGASILRATGPALGWVARRPTMSALASERGTLLPRWEDAVDRYIAAAPEIRARVAA